jgi:hypothetical protein
MMTYFNCVSHRFHLVFKIQMKKNQTNFTMAADKRNNRCFIDNDEDSQATLPCEWEEDLNTPLSTLPALTPGTFHAVVVGKETFYYRTSGDRQVDCNAIGEIYQRYTQQTFKCDEDGKTWLHVELMKLCPHPFAGQNFILKHYFNSKSQTSSKNSTTSKTQDIYDNKKSDDSFSNQKPPVKESSS